MVSRSFLRSFLSLFLLGFILGLGLGAYGFRTYLRALTFDDLDIEGESLLTVDHQGFQTLLDTYLVSETRDDITRFNYRAAQADRPTLDAYLAGLQAIDPAQLGSNEALAYWLNFYNAGMIQLVLERAEYDSVIANRSFYFLGDHFEVAGQKVSLDQIENQIIRVHWQEPRIHYGLNCASLSCPNLYPQAFTGADLDRQLDTAARAYVNHKRGVAGLQESRLVVSEIYDWFKEDFGGSDQGVIDHIAQFAEGDLAAQVAQARRIRVQSYDWALNIASP